MNRVWITDRIKNPDLEQAILGNTVSTEYDENAEVAMVWRTEVNQELIQRMPKLRAILRYGVGYERINVDFASSKNIYVCNNPTYCTEEVAATALAMILNISRNVVRLDSIAKTFSQGWQENSVPKGLKPSATTIGIVGAGNIGGQVIKMCLSLGYHVVYFDPYIDAVRQELFAQAKRVTSLDQIAKVADIISLHVPLTPETHGMINRPFFEKCKKGVSLVNTARGKIIESLDLILEKLQDGTLDQINLDVLPDEPPEDHPLIQEWRHSAPWLKHRLIINPHKAYLSKESEIEMRISSAKNALKVLNGERPDHIVSKKGE